MTCLRKGCPQVRVHSQKLAVAVPYLVIVVAMGTMGTAVGLTNTEGGPLDDFGDPSLPKGTLSELIA